MIQMLGGGGPPPPSHVSAATPVSGVGTGGTDQQQIQQIMQMLSPGQSSAPGGSSASVSNVDKDWLNRPVSQLKPEEMMKMMDIMNGVMGSDSGSSAADPMIAQVMQLLGGSQGSANGNTNAGGWGVGNAGVAAVPPPTVSGCVGGCGLPSPLAAG